MQASQKKIALSKSITLLVFKQHYNKKNGDIFFQQIRNTVKFIVVRHPFERLLSAYRDKLEHMQDREYYYKRYGQYITHRYRAKQSNLTNPEPSFIEFLRFIAKEKHFDEHWIPYVHSCQPCSIDYNFILKFESLTDEYNYFIKENNLQYYINYATNARENSSSQGITNDLVAEKYFQDIPVTLLSKIYKIYELDFLLFSYSPAKYYYMTKGSVEK